jgi:hypothetical protein
MARDWYTEWRDEWVRSTPGMMEYLGGYPLLSLACELVSLDRYFIRASELADLAHSAVIAKCGPCRHEPQAFIAKLARQGIQPERFHGRPPVYDMQKLRRELQRRLAQ